MRPSISATSGNLRPKHSLPPLRTLPSEGTYSLNELALMTSSNRELPPGPIPWNLKSLGRRYIKNPLMSCRDLPLLYTLDTVITAFNALRLFPFLAKVSGICLGSMAGSAQAETAYTRRSPMIKHMTIAGALPVPHGRDER